jgi:hypothetical protein
VSGKGGIQLADAVAGLEERMGRIAAEAKLARIRAAWALRRWRGSDSRTAAEIEAAEAELRKAIEEP